MMFSLASTDRFSTIFKLVQLQPLFCMFFNGLGAAHLVMFQPNPRCSGQNIWFMVIHPLHDGNIWESKRNGYIYMATSI